MLKVRKNVYETNSSSTHSICITKNDILDNKLDKVYFELGEFGWEYSILNDLWDKASYLYTGILYVEETELLDKLKDILDKNNIDYEFEDPEDADYYYIDHGNELIDFLYDVCNDEGKLMRYLFSSESFIITSNDNDYSYEYDDIGIDVNYDYDEYYKGN